jgi:hypothetical protein
MAAFRQSEHCPLSLFGDQTLSFAIAEKRRGATWEDLLAIAAHGAEFDAANQLLNKGSNWRT